MSTQHTPTPWQYFADFESVDVMTNDGLHIARMEHAMDEGEADAALIVRAVNSHAALVEALTLCRDRLALHAISGNMDAYEKAGAALKLARDGEG